VLFRLLWGIVKPITRPDKLKEGRQTLVERGSKFVFMASCHQNTHEGSNVQSDDLGLQQPIRIKSLNVLVVGHIPICLTMPSSVYVASLYAPLNRRKAVPVRDP
jgi:hypothetical protein